MIQKQRPRLGSAIASTILSLFSALSLVGVDKTQAAVLTYNFQVDEGGGSGFFKVNNSSVSAERGYQEIAVSEGRLNTPFILEPFFEERKEYYNLAGAIAIFYEGVFHGITGGGYDSATRELIVPPDQLGGPDRIEYSGRAFAYMEMYVQHYRGISIIGPSWFQGFKEVSISRSNGISEEHRQKIDSADVYYTLVNTEPEPVPEPLTVGSTALALAGLSWLKHKKKMAA
ncbi:PEP-CTERM sorting domain-containing protein [Microcoleus sp. Pol14C2]|uniref:PEP-CTERM sorting domain-containing protein n=1 Tax=unclassified Microcoleus TaxID=2642155 RepID=UPI002FCEB876